MLKEDSSSPVGWVIIFDLFASAPDAASASSLLSASAPKAKLAAVGGSVGFMVVGVAALVAIVAAAALKVAKGHDASADGAATPNLV